MLIIGPDLSEVKEQKHQYCVLAYTYHVTQKHTYHFELQVVQ